MQASKPPTFSSGWEDEWRRANDFECGVVADFLHERHDFKQLFVLFAGLSCRRTQTSDHWARLR